MIPLDTVLETERCVLRCTSNDDAPYIFSACKHPGFTDGMLWEPPSSNEEVYGYVKIQEEQWIKGEDYSMSIFLKEDDQFLGRVSTRNTEKSGVWNLGFWLHPDH